MFKQIKLALTDKPLLTIWRLFTFPFLFIAAALLYIVVALFNLGFEEANDFWNAMYLTGA